MNPAANAVNPRNLGFDTCLEFLHPGYDGTIYLADPAAALLEDHRLNIADGLEP